MSAAATADKRALAAYLKETTRIREQEKVVSRQLLVLKEPKGRCSKTLRYQRVALHDGGQEGAHNYGQLRPAIMRVVTKALRCVLKIRLGRHIRQF